MKTNKKIEMYDFSETVSSWADPAVYAFINNTFSNNNDNKLIFITLFVRGDKLPLYNTPGGQAQSQAGNNRKGQEED